MNIIYKTIAKANVLQALLHNISKVLLLGLFVLIASVASSQVQLSLAGSSNVTSIQSGNQFIYTLDYSVSSLTDVGHGVVADIALPSLLQLTDSVNLNNSVIFDNSQVASVSYNTTTRKLHVVFVEPFPAGSTGQLQAKLRYPNGITPNGYAPSIVTTMDANNNVNTPAQGGGTGPVTSNTTTVTAIATNAPAVGKSVSAGGAIDNLTIYRLSASNGGSNGSLILNSPVLRDTLPAGVLFVGATPFGGSNNPTTYGISGGKTVVQWTWSSPLSAGYSGGAYLSVKYTSPTFSVGSSVTNSATLTGTVNGLPIGTQIPQRATGNTTFNVQTPVTSGACNGGGISAATAWWLDHHVLSGTSGNTFRNGWYNSGNTEIDSVTLTYHIDEAVDFNDIKVNPVYDGLDSAAQAKIVVFYKTNLNGYIVLGTYYSLDIANGITPVDHVVTLPAGEYITDVKFIVSSYGGTKLPIGGKQDFSYNGNVRTTAQGKKNGQPIVEGTTYNPGNVGDDGTLIYNNSDGSYYFGGVATNYGNCGDRAEILSPRPVFYPPSKGIDGGDGSYRASDIVHYNGRFYLGGNVTANGIVITDTLDNRLIYQEGTSQYYNGSTWAPITPTVTPLSGGKTLLTYNIGSVTPQVDQYIKFDAQVVPGTLPGNIPNRIVVNANTINTLFTGPTDYVNLSVISAVALKVKKGQSGSCGTTGYVYYPTLAHTLQGGNVNYKITVTNQGNVVAKDFILIDAFPFIGDSRGSNYFANMAGPATVSDPLSTVYYTTTQNPCSDDLTPPINPSGCNTPTWSIVPPTDLTTITGLKLTRSADLPVFDSIEISWAMKAPVGVPFGNIMNNSVNYQVSRADNNAQLLPATPNQVGMVADCISPLGSLGNYVWVDRNKNGLQDEVASDGLNGVKVYLYKDNGSGTFVKVDSTITGKDFSGNPGYYLFPQLHTGDYKVQFQTSPLDGYYLTTPVNQASQTDGNSYANTSTGYSGIVHIDENGSGVSKDNMTIDAGYYPIGDLGNYVWYDDNRNGLQDEAANRGINGVKVYLYKDNGTGTYVKVDSTLTANDTSGKPGYYDFIITTSGNYKVGFPTNIGQTGITTQNTTAGTDGNSDASPTTGLTDVIVMDIFSHGIPKHNPTIDAGYKPLGSLGNYVWLDDNNNGIQDEPAANGVNGVKVYLYKDNGSNTFVKVDSTTTANDSTGKSGWYTFYKLDNGNYKVLFPTNIGNYAISDVTNQTAQTDLNNDANKATGFSGVATINVLAGGLNKDNPTIDAGYRTNIGSLGNYVWRDFNGNGLQDEVASYGINGVKVYLLNGVGTKIDSTVTANDGSGNPGYYNFPNLNSGNYQVLFPLIVNGFPLTPIVNQAMQVDGNQDADFTTGKSGVVTINTNSSNPLDVNNPTIDAGYGLLGTLGNYVWYDDNNNGIQDEPASNGINGVKVILYKETAAGVYTKYDSTITKTDSTGKTGWYTFKDLFSANYIVQFPTKVGNYPISDVTNQAPKVDGNNDADKVTGFSGVVAINIVNGGLDIDNPTIDAGYRTNIGSIGNYVWTDTNEDGINNESTTNGINGVKVYLLKETSPNVFVKVDSTVTANNGSNPGYYNFPNLNSANYKVQFPTSVYGSGLTLQTTTPQTDNNSDANVATGISPVVTINTSSVNPLDVNNPTIDAGYKYSVAPYCNMTASIGVNQIAQCVTNNSYQFTGNFTGGTGPYTYLWDFNDGTYGYTQNPTHTYATAGEHDVTLIVRDSRGCEAHASTVQIYIGAKPVAAFDVYGNSGTGSGITFSSTSTISGGWLTYNWDLGNGTTSTLVNPGPIYYAPGTYTVTLIATGNFGCSDTITKTIVVPSNGGTYCSVPTAAFTINSASQCVNGNVFTFTNATINGSTYKWNFGDGSAVVTTSAASHTYASAGTYTVTLIATNTCGSDTITKTVVVKPLPATPAAISGVTTVNAGNVITLSTSSTGGGVWSSSNPAVATVNAYGFVTGLSAGTTTISYTLSNDCGSVSATYVVTVIGSIVPPVTCVSPTANFTINTANQCLASNAYTFTNSTTGTSPTYAWDFGDGSTASTVNGTHTYSVAGTFNVKLDVTNACGTSTITKTVIISDVPAQPASISGTTAVLVGSTTALSSATTGGTWSSNNALVATVNPTTGLVTGIANGTATITYTVSNACGSASRSVTVTISTPVVPCVLPSTPAAITGITTLTVGATTTLSSVTAGGVWISSNTGVATINPSTGLITVVGTGTTTISYTVSNACGSNSVSTLVTVNTACVTPVANFTVNNATQCITGNSFIFNNTTSGTVDSYTWNFGDGSSTATSPTHTYAAAGTYTVTLQASSACGGSSKSITVTVQPGATAPAAIGGTPSVPVGSTTTLTSSTVGGAWSSSNTAVATVNPTTGIVTGVAAGTATISYIVNNGCGSASATLQVIVTVPCGAGTTSTTNATICQGTGYSFNGGYYTVAGSYTAHLTNAAGCDSAARLVLTVNPLPTQPTAITGTTSILVAGTTMLSSTPAGGAWSSANTSVATVNPSTGLVTGVATGSVAITYTVTNGCGSRSVSTTVIVGTPVVVVPPTPTCNLVAGFTINNNRQCVTDNQFVFTNTTTGGTAPYTYLWDLNDGTYASTQNVTKTYATYGEHDVTLKVTDAKGCVSNANAQQLYVGAKPKASFSILTNTGSGSNTTLISSSTIALGTMNYMWDLGNGQTSTLVNPTTTYAAAPATPYTIKLVVSGWGTCKDTAIQTYTQYTVSSVSVYPNPVMDAIQVSFRAASTTPTTIKIMDLAGRVLQVQTVTPISTGSNVVATLDTHGLQSGSYVVYISDVQNGFLATKAILKQ